MVIGVDFDNTIVCYDELFHRLATERALIPATLPRDKQSVRDYLRVQGQEDDWTELQGWAYGPRIGAAQPFPGVLDFFRACRQRGLSVYIISHKTRKPARGPQVDLHESAREWLVVQGFHLHDVAGLPRDSVFFAETKQEKLERIAALGCTHFIDDLPEFLLDPRFPPDVVRVLFDPWDRQAGQVPFHRAQSWDDLQRHLLSGEPS